MLVAQGIGIVAMLFNILSFQCKKNRHLMLMLGTGSLLFAVNYLLLGSLASAGFNVVSILRSVAVVNKKTTATPLFAVVCGLFVLVTVLTFDSIWTLALLAAMLASTWAMWYKDGAVIRTVQFFFVSPIWLINNIFMTFTVGGIICEVFTIGSVIISFIRYGKDGFRA